MFCIAAFIVLAFLAIFSASYRPLAKKAWQCVARRLTFRPCDMNFKDELKGKMLAKLILRRPRLAKFLDRWIDIFAFLFVMLTIWSLLSVAVSGLNLFVYNTCTPKNAESCALGAEACGISAGQMGFWQSVRQGEVLTWTRESIASLGETISRVPDRFKTWEPSAYLLPGNTYYLPYDPAKPIALEVIDPGCRFCAALFRNMKTAKFEYHHNLTYLVFPIPDPSEEGSFKFASSYLIASYLEAVKMIPPEAAPLSPPADWQILEKVFLENDTDGMSWQEKFNTLFTLAEAETQLQTFLSELGYSPEQRAQVAAEAASQEVAARLAEQKRIVEEEIKTLKIPTVIFNGKREYGALTVEELQDRNP